MNFYSNGIDIRYKIFGIYSFCKYIQHIYKGKNNECKFLKENIIVEQWNNLSEIEKDYFRSYPEGDVPFHDEDDVATILRFSLEYKEDPKYKEFVIKEINNESLVSTPRYNAGILMGMYQKNLSKEDKDYNYFRSYPKKDVSPYDKDDVANILKFSLNDDPKYKEFVIRENNNETLN